jgi:hypothetical protein
MTTVVREGGCLCGAVRYAVTGDARFLCFCHCNSCRRASGAMLVAWGTFKSTQFRITLGHPGEIATSPGVTRAHCGRCGTSLTYRNERRAGEIDVTLATFDNAADLQPTVHIWVEDKLPWVRFADGLPQYQKGVTGA